MMRLATSSPFPAHPKRRRGPPFNYTYDDDGNVTSILGGPSPQYFEYDSTNRTVCLGSSTPAFSPPTPSVVGVLPRRCASPGFAGPPLLNPATSISQAGVAQDSHSVRVGTKDPMGGVSTFVPDPGTGAVVETYSTYTDIPGTWTMLDVFGRPINDYVHNGTQWIRTKKIKYHDATLSQPPIVESMVLPFAGANVLTERIWNSVVSDSFGGVWKEITDSPSGSVGTITYHDPGSRVTQKTLPIACANMWCAGIDGDGEAIASRVESDALGRVVRQDTPYGFSVFDHTAVTKNSGPGQTGVQLDQVLVKNGKGDLIQRAMDGDRVVWVEECGNTVSPTATNIGGAGCGGADYAQTFYTYEATGELSTIHDALSPSGYDDPNHYLRYHFDTLGRIVQIDDPALDGTGHTLTSYDRFGNMGSVTNARGQQRTYAYDELDRLVGVTTPAGEVDYTVSYRTDEMQSSGDSSNDYARTLTFDSLGRVATEEMSIRNRLGFFQDFHTDFEYDLVGRVTQVLYPAQHYEGGEWVDTIVRYEYDKGYLEQICDLGSATDCDAATAKFVSQTQFDLLGRPEVFTFPAGTRTFEYTPQTHRLAKDEFVSATYQYTRNYAAYDEVGNVLSITGSESASVALDMNETYAYDERNRLSQWTKEGTDYLFDYDDLGNLVLHANESQEYTDAERPHAITSRGDPGSEVTYQYDADGNVLSIMGGASPQTFEYNSANQITCLKGTSPNCESRVAYDVAGQRIAEYPAGQFKAYVGNSFLYEDDQYDAKASVEVMLDGQRIALKRFDPQLRDATAGLFPITIPAPWIVGGLGGVGLVLLVWGIREDAFVLVEMRPLRAATAVGAATALAMMVPSFAYAGGGGSGASGPGYYWEMSDPLGTGMVLVDKDGERIRHQVFTPFGRIHAEEGASLRTFYAGHRRNDETGMFYMQARWYDPGSGRFLSTDPLIRTAMVPQSANAYSYSENNPVNGVDPTGTTMYIVHSKNSDGSSSTMMTEDYGEVQGMSITAGNMGGSVTLNGETLTEGDSSVATSMATTQKIGSPGLTGLNTTSGTQESGERPSQGDYHSASNTGSGDYSPDSTYVLPEGMTPDEARAMLDAQRGEGLGVERSGPIRGSGADVYAFGYKDGQFGTIHSRYGFIGGNAGTVDVPIAGGVGAARSAAKAFFRSEAAGFVRSVIRNVRSGGSGRIVGVRAGNATYRPKPDGSFSVTPQSGGGKATRHFRPTE